MKAKLFSLQFSLFALLFCSAATAQVHVQPVSGVHTITVEDNVLLKIYAGDKTQLEATMPVPANVAKVANGVMSLEGNSTVVLRLNPADGIVNFSAEDGASIVFFGGSFDFGDQKITISAEDNARVEMDVTANDLYASHAYFKAQDNSLIMSKMAPIHVFGYNFIANDNAYIEVPSVDLRFFDGDSTIDRNTYVTVTDYGKIVIKDKGPNGITVCDHEFAIGRKSKKPNRGLEFNWSWGFNHWGDKPFGGMDGDAEVTYSFLNLGYTLDYPLVNTPHFGLYAGFGVEVNRYHFREHLICATPTGFHQPSMMYPAYATITTGTPDPNNWDSYFITAAIVVPITFSFEPWKYDDFCIRLTALPGINFNEYLTQEYESKSIELTVRDKDGSKQVNPFVLDARLSLFYGSLGIYVQMATQRLFKSDFQDIYPVKFGLIWSLGGR